MFYEIKKLKIVFEISIHETIYFLVIKGFKKLVVGVLETKNTNKYSSVVQHDRKTIMSIYI